ncbi:MAG: hypothetical protein LAT61_10510 [Alcanivorax sp.]|nr:hypothetical protein [Alcanivorax sp.]
MIFGICKAFFLGILTLFFSMAYAGEMIVSAEISEVSISSVNGDEIIKIRIDRDVSSYFSEGCSLSDQDQIFLVRSSSVGENAWKLLYSTAMVALARKFDTFLTVDGCIQYQSGGYVREVFGLKISSI